MNNDAVFLRHFLVAIQRIEGYAVVGHEQFLRETRWQDAIIRQIEIVGEAAEYISPVLRRRYPHVVWRAPAAMRNILIQNYADVDLTIGWNATESGLPALTANVEDILDREPDLQLRPDEE